MSNQIAIVTGANSGMGLATTVEIAKTGAKVIMACRNEQRGEVGLQIAKLRSGSDDIDLAILDLGSLKSVRNFAEDFKKKNEKLDVLVNNAGIMTTKREITEDGFEAMMGINHLGHFLLTNLLLDELKNAEQGRIINVSSGAHKWADIYFDDPFFERGFFNPMKAYGQSKLANILFTKGLAEGLKGTNVTANTLHPGAVATNFGVSRNTGRGKGIMNMLSPLFLTPEEGAETAVYLATNPHVKNFTGKYFVKKQIAAPSKKAVDMKLYRKLWAWSEKQTGLENYTKSDEVDHRAAGIIQAHDHEYK